MVRKSTPAERMSSITWWTSSRCSPSPTITPDLVKMCGVLALDALEQPQRRIVTRARADRRIKPRHGLEIVVVDVGAGIDDRLDRAFALVAEIGGEDLDRGRRGALAQRLDHLDELRGAAVGKVVAVDRGDDDMLEAKLGGRGGDMLGLERIDAARHPGLDVAEGAGAGAGVAQDHHRRVLLGPALADVRAGRFLADGGEVELAHQPAGLGIAGAGRGLDPDPVGLALPLWALLLPRSCAPDSDAGRGLPPLPLLASGSAMPRLDRADRRLLPLPPGSAGRWSGERWAELAEGQSPKVMVIACSDSRVEPAEIFDARPGEMFVVRNVANLAPPYETTRGLHGVSAALEFAVTQLEVEEILVLGHGSCGGCAAALDRPVRRRRARRRPLHRRLGAAAPRCPRRGPRPARRADARGSAGDGAGIGKDVARQPTDVPVDRRARARWAPGAARRPFLDRRRQAVFARRGGRSLPPRRLSTSD